MCTFKQLDKIKLLNKSFLIDEWLILIKSWARLLIFIYLVIITIVIYKKICKLHRLKKLS